MKINLTKKEYHALLDVLQLADWILQARENEDDERARTHREFEQKILSLAGEFGCEQLVEKDPVEDRLYVSPAHEKNSPAMDFVDRFEDELFWEELIDRLVQRDLVRQLGEEDYKNLKLEDRLDRETPLVEHYQEHFSVHGLTHLELLG